MDGHKARLDRDLKGRFGQAAYAAEELIAELGAAFLTAEFSFDGDLRHAGYIETWIGLLRSDKRAFFTAASKAQAAADYLRGWRWRSRSRKRHKPLKRGCIRVGPHAASHPNHWANGSSTND